MKPYHADKPFSKGNFFFVTLWLRQALPEHFLQNLGLQFYIQQRRWAQHPAGEKQLYQIRKQLFARFDRALDDEVYGSGYLQTGAMTAMVEHEIKRRDGTDYDLHAYAIRPNHAHLLLELKGLPIANPPLFEHDTIVHPTLRHVVQSIQNASSKTLASALAQSGKHLLPVAFHKRPEPGLILPEVSLWHERSFDFQIQDPTTFEKVASFIRRHDTGTFSMPV